MNNKISSLVVVVVVILIGFMLWSLRTRITTVRRITSADAEGNCTVLYSNGWVRQGTRYCIFQVGDTVEVSP